MSDFIAQNPAQDEEWNSELGSDSWSNNNKDKYKPIDLSIDNTSWDYNSKKIRVVLPDIIFPSSTRSDVGPQDQTSERFQVGELDSDQINAAMEIYDYMQKNPEDALRNIGPDGFKFFNYIINDVISPNYDNFQKDYSENSITKLGYTVPDNLYDQDGYGIVKRANDKLDEKLANLNDPKFFDVSERTREESAIYKGITTTKELIESGKLEGKINITVDNVNQNDMGIQYGTYQNGELVEVGINPDGSPKYEYNVTTTDEKFHKKLIVLKLPPTIKPEDKQKLELLISKLNDGTINQDEIKELEALKSSYQLGGAYQVTSEDEGGIDVLQTFFPDYDSAPLSVKNKINKEKQERDKKIADATNSKEFRTVFIDGLKGEWAGSNEEFRQIVAKWAEENGHIANGRLKSPLSDEDWNSFIDSVGPQSLYNIIPTYIVRNAMDKAGLLDKNGFIKGDYTEEMTWKSILPSDEKDETEKIIGSRPKKPEINNKRFELEKQGYFLYDIETGQFVPTSTDSYLYELNNWSEKNADWQAEYMRVSNQLRVDSAIQDAKWYEKDFFPAVGTWITSGIDFFDENVLGSMGKGIMSTWQNDAEIDVKDMHFWSPYSIVSIKDKKNIGTYSLDDARSNKDIEDSGQHYVIFYNGSEWNHSKKYDTPNAAYSAMQDEMEEHWWQERGLRSYQGRAWDTVFALTPDDQYSTWGNIQYYMQNYAAPVLGTVTRFQLTGQAFSAAPAFGNLNPTLQSGLIFLGGGAIDYGNRDLWNNMTWGDMAQKTMIDFSIGASLPHIASSKNWKIPGLNITWRGGNIQTANTNLEAWVNMFRQGFAAGATFETGHFIDTWMKNFRHGIPNEEGLVDREQSYTWEQLSPSFYKALDTHFGTAEGKKNMLINMSTMLLLHNTGNFKHGFRSAENKHYFANTYIPGMQNKINNILNVIDLKLPNHIAKKIEPSNFKKLSKDEQFHLLQNTQTLIMNNMIPTFGRLDFALEKVLEQVGAKKVYTSKNEFTYEFTNRKLYNTKTKKWEEVSTEKLLNYINVLTQYKQFLGSYLFGEKIVELSDIGLTKSIFEKKYQRDANGELILDKNGNKIEVFGEGMFKDQYGSIGSDGKLHFIDGTIVDIKPLIVYKIDVNGDKYIDKKSTFNNILGKHPMYVEGIGHIYNTEGIIKIAEYLESYVVKTHSKYDTRKEITYDSKLNLKKIKGHNEMTLKEASVLTDIDLITLNKLNPNFRVGNDIIIEKPGFFKVNGDVHPHQISLNNFSQNLVITNNQEITYNQLNEQKVGTLSEWSEMVGHIYNLNAIPADQLKAAEITDIKLKRSLGYGEHEKVYSFEIEGKSGRLDQDTGTRAIEINPQSSVLTTIEETLVEPTWKQIANDNGILNDKINEFILEFEETFDSNPNSPFIESGLEAFSLAYIYDLLKPMPEALDIYKGKMGQIGELSPEVISALDNIIAKHKSAFDEFTGIMLQNYEGRSTEDMLEDLFMTIKEDMGTHSKMPEVSDINFTSLKNMLNGSFRIELRGYNVPKNLKSGLKKGNQEIDAKLKNNLSAESYKEVFPEQHSIVNTDAPLSDNGELIVETIEVDQTELDKWEENVFDHWSPPPLVGKELQDNYTAVELKDIILKTIMSNNYVQKVLNPKEEIFDKITIPKSLQDLDNKLYNLFDIVSDSVTERLAAGKVTINTIKEKIANEYRKGKILEPVKNPTVEELELRTEAIVDFVRLLRTDPRFDVQDQVGWWDDQITYVKDKTAKEYPELNDTNINSLWKILTGITSQGTGLNENYNAGLYFLDNYLNTGEFNVKKPDGLNVNRLGEPIMKSQLNKLQTLVEHFGSYKAVEDWLILPTTVGKLKTELKAMGLKPEAATTSDKRKGVDLPTYNAMVFGPKIGAMIGVLNGVDLSVNDLWMNRLYQVATGDVFKGESFNPTQLRLLNNAMEGVAKELGVSIRGAQAISWVLMKQLFSTYGAKKDADDFTNAVKLRSELNDNFTTTRASEGIDATRNRTNFAGYAISSKDTKKTFDETGSFTGGKDSYRLIIPKWKSKIESNIEQFGEGTSIKAKSLINKLSKGVSKKELEWYDLEGYIKAKGYKPEDKVPLSEIKSYVNKNQLQIRVNERESFNPNISSDINDFFPTVENLSPNYSNAGGTISAFIGIGITKSQQDFINRIKFPTEEFYGSTTRILDIGNAQPIVLWKYLGLEMPGSSDFKPKWMEKAETSGITPEYRLTSGASNIEQLQMPPYDQDKSFEDVADDLGLNNMSMPNKATALKEMAFQKDLAVGEELDYTDDPQILYQEAKTRLLFRDKTSLWFPITLKFINKMGIYEGLKDTVLHFVAANYNLQDPFGIYEREDGLSLSFPYAIIQNHQVTQSQNLTKQQLSLAQSFKIHQFDFYDSWIKDDPHMHLDTKLKFHKSYVNDKPFLRDGDYLEGYQESVSGKRPLIPQPISESTVLGKWIIEEDFDHYGSHAQFQPSLLSNEPNDYIEVLFKSSTEVGWENKMADALYKTSKLYGMLKTLEFMGWKLTTEQERRPDFTEPNYYDLNEGKVDMEFDLVLVSPSGKTVSYRHSELYPGYRIKSKHPGDDIVSSEKATSKALGISGTNILTFVEFMNEAWQEIQMSPELIAPLRIEKLDIPVSGGDHMPNLIEFNRRSYLSQNSKYLDAPRHKFYMDKSKWFTGPTDNYHNVQLMAPESGLVDHISQIPLDFIENWLVNQVGTPDEAFWKESFEDWSLQELALMIQQGDFGAFDVIGNNAVQDFWDDFEASLKYEEKTSREEDAEEFVDKDLNLMANFIEPTHFAEPNTIGWIRGARISETYDNKGKPILRDKKIAWTEEAQSDWNTKWSKYDKAKKVLDSQLAAGTIDKNWYNDHLFDLQHRFSMLNADNKPSFFDGNQWLRLVAKRHIKYLIDRGYDGVVLNSGLNVFLSWFGSQYDNLQGFAFSSASKYLNKLVASDNNPNKMEEFKERFWAVSKDIIQMDGQAKSLYETLWEKLFPSTVTFAMGEKKIIYSEYLAEILQKGKQDIYEVQFPNSSSVLITREGLELLQFPQSAIDKITATKGNKMMPWLHTSTEWSSENAFIETEYNKMHDIDSDFALQNTKNYFKFSTMDEYKQKPFHFDMYDKRLVGVYSKVLKPFNVKKDYIYVKGHGNKYKPERYDKYFEHSYGAFGAKIVDGAAPYAYFEFSDALKDFIKEQDFDSWKLKIPPKKKNVTNKAYDKKLSPGAKKKQAENKKRYTSSGQVKKSLTVARDIYFRPVSSVLKGFSTPTLFRTMRKAMKSETFDAANWSNQAEPFVQYLKNLEANDFSLFEEMWIALSIGDISRVEKIITDTQSQKWGIELGEYNKIGHLMDQIYEYTADNGGEIGKIEEYFPRSITGDKNRQGLFSELELKYKDIDLMVGFQETLKKREKELGRKLDDHEEAAMLNSYLSGYMKFQSGPGNLKKRTMVTLDRNTIQYYDKPYDSLLSYIETMAKYNARIKLFGKGSIDDSIGVKLLDLVKKGELSQDKLQLAQRILTSHFETKHHSAWVEPTKNLVYMYTMGSFISAITQIGDQTWAIYENGLLNTLYYDIKSLLKLNEVDLKMLGTDKLMHELASRSRSGEYLNKIFSINGLRLVDRLGKESLVNGKLKLYRKLANGKSYNSFLRAFQQDRDLRRLDRYFEESEKAQLFEDLRSGEVTDLVKELLFNVLLDWQPVARSEVPSAYKDKPLWYQLKTYTVKQVNSFKDNAIDEIIFYSKKYKNSSGEEKSKNRKLLLEAITSFLALVGTFIVTNGTGDAIKDEILERDWDPSDVAVQQFWKLIGLSRYNLFQFRREGWGYGMLRLFSPAGVSIPTDISRDIYTVFDRTKNNLRLNELKKKEESNTLNKREKRELRKLEEKLEKPLLHDIISLKGVPIGGKPYYWWKGRGKDQTLRFSFKDLKEKAMEGLLNKEDIWKWQNEMAYALENKHITEKQFNNLIEYVVGYKFMRDKLNNDEFEFEDYPAYIQTLDSLWYNKVIDFETQQNRVKDADRYFDKKYGTIE